VGSALSADQVATIEHHVAIGVAAITSIDALKEWLAQMAALEAYLRGREMQAPALGAARRVEGRIGQLLGEPQRGKVQHHNVDLHDNLIFEFRLLARALSGDCPLTPDEWRKSRILMACVVMVTLRTLVGLSVLMVPASCRKAACSNP